MLFEAAGKVRIKANRTAPAQTRVVRCGLRPTAPCIPLSATAAIRSDPGD